MSFEDNIYILAEKRADVIEKIVEEIGYYLAVAFQKIQNIPPYVADYEENMSIHNPIIRLSHSLPDSSTTDELSATDYPSTEKIKDTLADHFEKEEPILIQNCSYVFESARTDGRDILLSWKKE